MQTAKSASAYIYEGIWTDWSKGSIIGSTITVSPHHASILSPAIAIFVSIAGSQLWRIFQFALHQFRANKVRTDYLYHQQQIVLRNTGADLNALWRLMRLGIAWRNHRTVSNLATTLPLVFWTLVHFVTVVVASVLSSWALNAGEKALSRSPFCGTFNQTYLSQVYETNVSDPATPRLAMEYASYTNERWAAVQQHVDICSTSVEGCDGLPVKDLPSSWAVVPGACPFTHDACHSEIDGSISFDTGYMSSMHHLGINAPAHQQVSIRLTAQCAPLNNAKYTTGWQDVTIGTNASHKMMADALFGVSQYSDRNASFSITAQDVSCDQRKSMTPYALDAQYFAAGGSIEQGTATFVPIPELKSPEADLSVLILSLNNAYGGPVYDPWFAASTPQNDSNAFCIDQNSTFYTRDRPLTGLGCTQQFQFCNTTKDEYLDEVHCTMPMGIQQLYDSMFESNAPMNVSFNSDQLAFIYRFDQVAVSASYYYVAYALSKATSAPLKARNLMSTTAGLPLPTTQWQTETKYWTKILLAYVQQSWLDFSTGQFSPNTTYINVTRSLNEIEDSDSADRAAAYMCANQIVLTSDYRNYSFFGLVMTLIFGSFVILLGLSIEDIIGCIRQRQLNYVGSDEKREMWMCNSDIEMLKTISELRSETTWTRSKNGVPLPNTIVKASFLKEGIKNHGRTSTKAFQSTASESECSDHVSWRLDVGIGENIRGHDRCNAGAGSRTSDDSEGIMNGGRPSKASMPIAYKNDFRTSLN